MKAVPVVPIAPRVVAELTRMLVAVAVMAPLSLVKIIPAPLMFVVAVPKDEPLLLLLTQSTRVKAISGWSPFTSAQTTLIVPVNGPPGLPLAMLNVIVSFPVWSLVMAELLAGVVLNAKLKS